MAIFGRSFPFPRRYVGQFSHSLQASAWTSTGTGAAAWVGVPRLQGKIVHVVRLPDRPRPKLGVFIGRPLFSVQRGTLSSTGTGAAAWVGLAAVPQKIVHVVRLPDRTRPKLGIFIGRFSHSVQPATWSVAGTGAASWISNAVVPVSQKIIRPIRLADRPRPKLGVFVGHGLRLVFVQGIWTSAGTGAAAWTGAATDAATWNAAGIGGNSWIAFSTATQGGGAGVVLHSFSRRRFQELMAELTAEQEAAVKAAEKAKPERARIIQKAIRASGILGDAIENNTLTSELVAAAELHLANLRAVAAARSRAEAAAKTAVLIRQVEELLDNLEEEELEMLLFLN